MEFEGARASVGCLDVAVAAHADGRAEGPAVRLAMGNFCDGATEIDVRSVRVVAYYADGRVVELEPRDPRGELRPAWLDGRSTATEVIEYADATDWFAWWDELVSVGEAGEGWLVRAERPAEICVDVAGIDALAPSARPVVTCVKAAAADLLVATEVAR